MFELLQLTCGYAPASLGDALDNPVVMTTPEAEAQCEQVVPRYDGLRQADRGVQGGLASTQLGLVVYVVVDEGRRVDYLRGHCEVHDLGCVLAASGLEGQGSHYGSVPLTPSEKYVACQPHRRRARAGHALLHELLERFLDDVSASIQLGLEGMHRDHSIRSSLTGVAL